MLLLAGGAARGRREPAQGADDLALVSGVHIMLSPEVMFTLSRAGMLSPDGRCKTFDASTDGYGRGEGVGVVVLKRQAVSMHMAGPCRPRK